MAEEQEDNMSGTECTEDSIKTLQKKLQDDFAQMESVQLKVKALSEDWLETHQRLKAEEMKVTELEAQIDSLNLRHERAKAALQADIARARAQVKEKEEMAEKLRAEVAMLEQKVEAACQEAARSAAELEKGAHEAWLALEATLAELTGQKGVAQEGAVEEHTGEAAPHSQDGVVDLEESREGVAESKGKDDHSWLPPKDTPDLGQGEVLPHQEENPGAFRPAATSEFNNSLLNQCLFSFCAICQWEMFHRRDTGLSCSSSASGKLKYQPPVTPPGGKIQAARLETGRSGQMCRGNLVKMWLSGGEINRVRL